MGQAMFSLGSGVILNTFSASLEGFQVQHCSSAALFASSEGRAAAAELGAAVRDCSLSKQLKHQLLH